VFAGLCALVVFEGGWYLLPAVVAFAACDAAGLGIELPSLPDDAAGHELGAAIACALLGWLGLVVALSGPIYGSASSTASATGVVVNTPPQVGLLQAGLPLQTALLLGATAALFGLVTIAALVHVRSRRRDAWRALVAITATLVMLVALGTITVGLRLVPGGVLALASVRLGRSM